MDSPEVKKMNKTNDHEIRKQSPDDNWTTRITAIGAIVSPALMLLVLWFQTQASQQANIAAKKADTAADTAKDAAKVVEQVKDTLHESIQDQKRHDNQILKNTLETKASLNEWKASYTKDPEDMAKAEEAKQALVEHFDGSTRSDAKATSSPP